MLRACGVYLALYSSSQGLATDSAEGLADVTILSQHVKAWAPAMPAVQTCAAKTEARSKGSTQEQAEQQSKALKWRRRKAAGHRPAARQSTIHAVPAVQTCEQSKNGRGAPAHQQNGREPVKSRQNGGDTGAGHRP